MAAMQESTSPPATSRLEATYACVTHGPHRLIAYPFPNHSSRPDFEALYVAETPIWAFGKTATHKWCKE